MYYRTAHDRSHFSNEIVTLRSDKQDTASAKTDV